MPRAWLLGVALLGLGAAGVHAATLTVTNLNDSGSGSLRAQIAAANGGDTIIFQTGLSGTITLASTLSISQFLTIQGPGANMITVSGNHAVLVFDIVAGTVTISGLTIANGSHVGFGGGIFNSSTLTVTGVTFSGNSASSSTSIGEGGGISNSGTLTVSNSTFSGNSAISNGSSGVGSLGGAILAFGGRVTVSNSTFSGNSAISNGSFSFAQGGAIYVNSGLVTVSDSTFYGNSTNATGGFNSSAGGAMYTAAGTLTVNNDIVSGNSAGPNGNAIFNAATVNASNNVFFNNIGGDCHNCNTNTNEVTTDPELLPLGNYGGTTQTMLPQPGSSAICAGSSTLVPGGTTTDQRGFFLGSVCANGGVDAGAVQSAYELVTTLSDATHTFCALSTCSLRDLISINNIDIDFDPSLTSTTHPGTITLGSALPAITGQVNIVGPGANQLSISGNNSTTVGSVLTVNSGAQVFLYGLTITDGNNNGSNGGGIHSSGTLTVMASAISGNTSSHAGGGIFTDGILTLIDSTVSGNTAGDDSGGGGVAGGIFNDGTLTLIGSTVAGNTVAGSVGDAFGGGIYNEGTATLMGSTVAGNTASVSGGIPASGGGISNNGIRLTLTNSIVAGNSVTGPSAFYADIAGGYTDNGGNQASNDGSATSTIAINLSPLQLNGIGATVATMIPLPGSPAICAGLKANTPSGTTTDERGYPNTNTTYAGYSSGSPCVDSGAVQTNYTAVQWVQQPTTVFFPATISPSPTVEVLETDTLLSSNNTDAVNGVPVTITFNGPGNLGSGALTETTSGGVAMFANLLPNDAAMNDTLETDAITVTTGVTLPTVTSGSFDVIGALSQFVVSAPSTAVAGTGFNVTVTAEDAAGNTVTNFSGAVTLSSTDSRFAGSHILSISNGTGAFSAVLLTAGIQTISAAQLPLPLVSGTSGPITVSAGIPVNFSATAGTPQSAYVNAAFVTSLTITLTDPFGNPVSGDAVTFTPPVSGASATLSTPAVTNASGQASVTATANGTAGAYTVTATLFNGVTASFSLTNNALPNYVVTTTADDTTGTPSNCPIPSTGTNCTLRDAITAANSAGVGNITFKSGVVGTITLGSALPALTGTIHITGPGANQLSISGNNSTTVGSVLTINSGAQVLLDGLTIAGGNNLSGVGGGGILNNGSATVLDCAVSGNHAEDGGGIANEGTITLTDSTISGNSGGYGGGIVNLIGSMTIVGSTVVNNEASGGGAEPSGGGIYNGGTITMTGSTVYDNTVAGVGGGIANDGTLTLANSIVAGNSASAFFGGTASNADIDNNGGSTYNGATGAGNVASTNSSTTSQINIQLGPLQYNGIGATLQTTIPLPGSAAICAGLKANIPAGVTTDERGYPNTNSTYTGYSSGSPCVDSGAVQTNYTSTAFVQQPTNTLVSAVITPSPTVEVLETDTLLSSNNTDAVSGIPFTLTLAGGSGTLGGTLTQTSTGGVASFGNLTVSAPGANDELATNALTVVSNGTGTTTLAAVDSDTFEVIGPATHFAVSATSPATVGGISSVIVTAEDMDGNTVTAYRGTVHLTSTDAAAVLPANYSFTSADNGQHTFSVTMNTAGSKTVTATDTTNSTLTGTSNAITVNAGPAAQLIFTTSPPTPLATVGNAGTVIVQVEDAEGNVVTTATGSIKLSVTGPGSYAQSYTATPASGIATFNLSSTLLSVPGTYDYQASSTTPSLSSTIMAEQVTLGLPTVTSVSPNAGTIAGGTVLTITGTNFTGATAVTIGGLNVSNLTVVSSTEILATTQQDVGVPVGTPVNVLVFNAAGNSSPNASDLFTYTEPLALLVTVATDDATGVPGNCPNQNVTPVIAGPHCSLRDAVAAANAQFPGITSSITFASGLGSNSTPGKITLVNGPLALNQNATITGLGTTALLIDGNSASSSNTTGNILQVNAGVTASISNLTMQNASTNVPGLISQRGGAMYNDGTLTLTGVLVQHSSSNGQSGGAGIYNDAAGVLTLNQTTFANNVTSLGGGSSGLGGAILNNGGSLTMTASTLNQNEASLLGGNLFSNGGTVVIANSTITGSGGTNAGGGLGVTGGTVTVADSTIAFNNASSNPGVQVSGGTVTVTNSIVAANGSATSTGNCSGCTLGTGNLVDVNPQLSVLGSYGGPTQTLVPLTESPAICLGVATSYSTDQRGFARPAGSCFDIGAAQTQYAIAFVQQPANTLVNTAVAPAVTVTALDHGIGIPGSAINLTLTGAGTLSGTLPELTDTTGTATFPDLSGNTIATGDTLTAAGNSTLTVTSNAFNITGGAPAITFSPTPATQVYGTAIASGSLDATATLSGSTVAGTFAYTTIIGGVPNQTLTTGTTVLPVGNYTITASFTPSNTTLYSATSTTASYSVTQASQTVTFAPPTSPLTYGVAPITLNATGGASGNTVVFSVVSGPGSITGSTLTVTGSGTIVIAANQAGNTNYSAATQVTQGIIVNAASQTVTFTPPTSPVTYGVAPITLSATGGASGNAVVFSVVSGPGTITGSTLTATGAGTIVIAANQAGNTNYSAATQVTQSIVVNAASQTITFTPPTSPLTYGVAPIILSATGGPSGNAIVFSIVSGPGTITGSTLTVTGVGTIVIAANQAGNANYSAATQVTQSIVVNAASQTITFTPPTSPVTYGVAAVTLNATGGASGNTVTFSVVSGPGTITGSTLTVTGTGTIVIAANQAGNANYSTATQVTQSIVVNAASQTITFTPPASPVTYGVAPITLSATGGPSGNAIVFSIVSGPGTITGSTLTVTGAGTIVIAANQAGNANYSAATQVTQSIVVNVASQTINFTPPTSPVTYGVAPITLSATGGASGNTVVFSVVSGPGAITGSTLTVTGVGTIVIAANQAGNTNYSVATQVTRSLVVSNAVPTIVLRSSANPVLAQNALTLTATVSSSTSTPTGTVTFLDGATPLGNGLLSGGVATFTTSSLAVGSHSITAVYSGDANFASVTSSVLTETIEDFNFTISSPSVTAPPNGTAIFNFTVTPVNSTTFPAPVTLSVSGLPAGATYTFSSATLSAGSTTTTVTLTVQIPRTTAALHHDRGRSKLAPFALAFLLLPFAGRMRKTAKRLERVLCLLLLFGASISAVTGLTGCGTGGNGYFGQSQQTYAVIVTGTSGTLSHSTTVTLTVE
jgi:CSLREA domain-containing protein